MRFVEFGCHCLHAFERSTSVLRQERRGIKASIVQGEYTFPHELFRDVTDQAMGFVGTLLSYTIEYRYTAAQALAHPWLATHCDPEALARAREGARGVGIVLDGSGGGRPEPMQL